MHKEEILYSNGNMVYSIESAEKQIPESLYFVLSPEVNC